MHELLVKQIAEATTGGQLDVDCLLRFVSQTYERLDEPRASADRLSLACGEPNQFGSSGNTAHAELTQHIRTLEAALAHMTQGVAMFDANRRLVLCNMRYREIYDFPPSLLVVGTPFVQLAEHNLSKNFAPEDRVPEYVPGHLEEALTVAKSVQCLRDGRIISLTRQPMQEGGWVTTHEDISARETLHAELQKQYDLVKQQQELLEAQAIQFLAAINNMKEAFCFFGGDQRLIICNKRYAEMCGLPQEALPPGIHLRETFELRYHVGTLPKGVEPDEFYGERNEIIAGNKPADPIIEFANGSIWETHHQPMPDGGWVSTHEEITNQQKLLMELKQQHEIVKMQQAQFREKNLQFDVAINNISQGLCFFDGNRRLLVCNDRYSDMYNLDAKRVYPGISLRDVLDLRYAAGTAPLMSKEDYYSWRENVATSDHAHDSTVELQDGRIFVIHHRPMPDGGWVATHDDVTERHQLHSELTKQYEIVKAQQEQLSQRNLQFDIAINNMSQGLCFFDKDQKLVVCNRRYIEMYNINPADVYPGIALREIIDLRHAAKSAPAMGADEYYVWRNSVAVAREPSETVIELADGRIFMTHFRPMADGGWVATHDDITEQRRAEAKIAYLAQHDILTGLANRALLKERMTQALNRAKSGEIIALHLVDLDHFKLVNDTLGHPAGDILLNEVANRLRAITKEADTLSRLGGDEFAVLQVAMADWGQATALAQRIVEDLSAPYVIDGQEAIIGATIGIALADADGFEPDHLVRKADIALYKAKAAGRGTFRVFEKEMDSEMQRRGALEQELRHALSAGAFELRFQPVMRTHDNTISGFGAIAFWNHPNEGWTPQDRFLSLAEETGLAMTIGEWILRGACLAASSWPRHLNVAVNLSPLQFRNPALPLVVAAALGASGLPAENLELEVPGSALLSEDDTTLAILKRLHGLGVQVAIDNLGFPSSITNYLQEFPFCKIKVGQPAARDRANKQNSPSPTSALLAFARDLGVATAAKGIETNAQSEKAAAAGCIELQGELFGSPLRVEELDAFMFHNSRIADNSAPSAA